MYPAMLSGTAFLRRSAKYQFQMPVVNVKSGRDEKATLPRETLSRTGDISSHLFAAARVLRVRLLA